MIFDIINTHIATFLDHNNVDADSSYLFHSVLDALEEVILIKDPNGKHLYVNKNYEIAVGCKREDVIGKTDHQIFADNIEIAKAITMKDKLVFSSKKMIKYEEMVPSLQGHEKWYLTTKTPLFDKHNNVIALACLATDITRQKQLEFQLQLKTKQQTEFFAKLSHEIRNPLNAISGLTNIAQAEFKQQHSELSVYLDHIHQATQHLGDVVEDILDYSSFELNEHHLNIQSFNLEQLFEQLETFAYTLHTNKDVSLTFNRLNNINYQILGDKTRIFQVFNNLINNAQKFTEYGFINATISSKVEQQQVQINICISDSGVGIAHQDIDKITDCLYQADLINLSSQSGAGLGLGLALCSQILNAMGGTLTIESKLNEGSRFNVEFTLPLSQLTENMVCLENISPPKTNYPNIKALVVDDIDLNVLVPGYHLNSFGIQYITASNGVEAVEKCKEQQFDLILMDIHMPVMDGEKAVKTIRQIESYAKTPIIALTANTTLPDKLSYLESGMNKVLSKPLKEQALRQVLAELLL